LKERGRKEKKTIEKKKPKTSPKKPLKKFIKQLQLENIEDGVGACR